MRLVIDRDMVARAGVGVKQSSELWTPGGMQRDQLFELLEHGQRRNLYSRGLDWLLVAMILADVATVIAGSLSISSRMRTLLTILDIICVTAFVVEYAARLWAAPAHPAYRGKGDTAARLAFALTPLMIIDAIALLPTLAEWFWHDVANIELLRILRFLKLARYSPALGTVGWIILTERRALLACLVILFGVMLSSAAFMLAAEGSIQPQHLGDMPKALWWSASMLAKIGGSEVTPVTAAGRVIAAITVMLGIFCFALPVAILGRGFYSEIRKRDFVVTFAMVARVPLFSGLDAAALAELVGVLTARTVAAGTVIVRKGDRGDALYFIASGLVEVRDSGEIVLLRDTDFFGEMALLNGAPRSATVVAMRVTDLLVLEVEDFDRLVRKLPEFRRRIEETTHARRAPDPSRA